MFTSVTHTKQITGRDVDLALLNRAQSIVEIYIGRVEANVDNPNDTQLLAKATAYQAVYMQDNEDIVYEQVALRTAGQGESVVSFADGQHAPYMAPLAIIACKALSFKRARGIRTGKIFQFPAFIDYREGRRG
jgi:hypothetical protein